MVLALCVKGKRHQISGNRNGSNEQERRRESEAGMLTTSTSTGRRKWREYQSVGMGLSHALSPEAQRLSNYLL